MARRGQYKLPVRIDLLANARGKTVERERIKRRHLSENGNERTPLHRSQACFVANLVAVWLLVENTDPGVVRLFGCLRASVAARKRDRIAAHNAREIAQSR